jgi:hypothetical protein
MLVKKILTLLIIAIFFNAFFVLGQASSYSLPSELPYKIGLYYFGIYSRNYDGAINGTRQIYGRAHDWWGGVKDFFGMEPGIQRNTRGWNGDFSHLKPIIGYYDNSDTSTLEKHVKQAKQNGISYFNFYWYWNKDEKRENYNDGLDAFLAARNSEDLGFTLSIFSHPWNNLLISAADAPLVVDLIIKKYFTRTNYLHTRSGKPIITIGDSRGIKNGNRAAAQYFVALLKKRSQQLLGKLPFVLYNIDLSEWNRMVNVDGYTCIVPAPDMLPTSMMLRTGNYNNSYRNMIKTVTTKFNDIVTLTKGRPFVPCFASNFDERPRQDIMIPSRDRIRYYPDHSLHLYRIGLSNIKHWMDRQNHELAGVLNVYAWNEWHEGGIIEPNVRDGSLYLNILADIFRLPTGFDPCRTTGKCQYP